MPIEPAGKPTIDRTPESDGSIDATVLAAQLVQSARAAQTSGNPSWAAGSWGELVNAITSQMGLPDLPSEHRQNLITRLAEDPVVKGLIG